AFDVQVPRSVRKIAAATLPLGVVAHPDSRFAGRKELKLFDLSGERVILSDGSLALGLSVEEAISRSIIDLTRRSRTNSIGMMIELAKLNLGTVLQTRIGVEAEVADGTLIFVPLHDAKIPPRRLM
ncbi:MAG: LysR family transcriptional regulator, partial [Mesorhizobium sp.]